MRNGVGWKAGVVGSATVGADLASPAGYAFHTGLPVVSNHLAAESRFRTPAILAEHDIRRAINVIIADDGTLPFGVLEADSSGRAHFTAQDVGFPAVAGQYRRRCHQAAGAGIRTAGLAA